VAAATGATSCVSKPAVGSALQVLQAVLPRFVGRRWLARSMTFNGISSGGKAFVRWW